MNVIDIVLTLVLVVALPVYMLAKSVAYRGGAAAGDRVARYRRTLVMIVVPLLAVVALWTMEQRPVAALGLGAPDRVAIVLIVVVSALIGTLTLIAPRARRPTDPARAVAAARMLPAGRRETAWFIAFAFAAGIGWEVLYRGYLWWALAPMIGAIGAVLVMALSYGVAHGYHGKGALAGSLVSALLFAGGYALTGSLWWLIVLHVGLPLLGLRVRPTVTA